MKEATAQKIAEGTKVMYRDVDGERLRIEFRGLHFIKTRPVLASGAWNGTSADDLEREGKSDLVEDLRASADACYCDACTHCDYCRGLRSPSFKYATRSNEIAHRRDRLMV